jgi:DHA2 family lincomycin resistance protein-like MFS transporter
MTHLTAPPVPATRRPRKSNAHEKLAPGNALVIGLLMSSAFLVLLNEMLLGVALPTLIRDLNVSATSAQWLTTGYLLTLAVLIPATGFVMRRFHLRTIFLTALSIFIVGTALAAAAPGFGMLLAGRIVQAVGTAVFVPLLMTTTLRLVPESRRGSIMALATAVPAIAPALGPAISGLVLTFLPWRWLFILVLPLAVVALLLGAAKLRNITTPEPATLDVLSLLLSALGFGALVFGLSSIGESASGHALITPVIPIVIGLIGIAVFALRQIIVRRRREPFMDMRIFGNKLFVVSLLAMMFIASNAFGVSLVLPLVLTGGVGLETLAVGLFLVPGGVVIAAVSALSGRVFDRVGPLPLVIPGALIWTASIWFLSTLHASNGVWVYLAGYLVLTAAQAMMWAPFTTLALSSLPANLYSHGTAAFSTMQQLAGAAGGAILISAYAIGGAAQHAGALTATQAITAGHTAFTTAGFIAFGVILSALGLVVTVVVRRRAATKRRS